MKKNYQNKMMTPEKYEDKTSDTIVCAVCGDINWRKIKESWVCADCGYVREK